MAKISIIDDDYATGLLLERLKLLGHAATQFTAVDDALGDIQSIASSDLIILDIIMPPPSALATTVSGGSTSGLSVYKEIRNISKNVTIVAYSGSTNAEIIDFLRRDEHVLHISKWNAPSLNDVVTRIERLLDNGKNKVRPRAFIVHGHDEEAKFALKNYLQNTLGFQEPIILHEQSSAGRTIIEKFEESTYDIDYVFILLTPDDVIVETDSNTVKRQTRQNVIFEMGYFFGFFGRRSGRVFLLYKGTLDLPSDIGGLIYIDISDGVERAGELIRRELGHVDR